MLDKLKKYLKQTKQGYHEVPSLSPKPSLRRSLSQYISGNGIEIGALHQPLDLTGLSISKIRYVDRKTEQQLRETYPELGQVALTHVDVVDDGERLNQFPDHSLDFIIGNHFIEHTRNPIGTIENWLKKLHPKGCIFMGVPNKLYTFDKDRPITPLSHLLKDYQIGDQDRNTHDRIHFEEWARFVDKLPEDEIEQRVKFLVEIDYSIHFHTFVMSSFLEMLDHMRTKMKFPFVLTACADTIPGSDEFMIVLSKI